MFTACLYSVIHLGYQDYLVNLYSYKKICLAQYCVCTKRYRFLSAYFWASN